MVKMLLLQSFCKHQKVVYGQPSIKCTSWKGNDMLLYYVTKSRLDVQFVQKISSEMVIGQRMKDKGYDQI